MARIIRNAQPSRVNAAHRAKLARTTYPSCRRGISLSVVLAAMATVVTVTAIADLALRAAQPDDARYSSVEYVNGYRYILDHNLTREDCQNILDANAHGVIFCEEN